jgi:oligopeptide/dipeptide ABC transporter ATP-binding protein
MDVLKIKDLSAGYFTEQGFVEIVANTSFSLKKGELLGIAGESGSGKTTLVSAIMNALSYPGIIKSGKVEFDHQDLLKMKDEEIRKLRGVHISYVPQGSMDSLNPVKRIIDQFWDVVDSHEVDIKRKDVEEIIKIVHLDSDVLSRYPHEISGGMKQRVILAMSLMYKPDVVVMDEPTTGLDVLVQYEILKTIKELQKEFSLSLIFITHDISLLFEIADRVMVLYGGEIMEIGPYQSLLDDAKHPYTMLLLNSIPSIKRPINRLASIPGQPISFAKKPSGCLFSPRCPFVKDQCKLESIKLLEANDVEYRCIRYPKWREEST